ncbi:hypothetical protein N658DRAFT_557444 [Parathielavia hyrcaniae]|uniref:Uncharacterized protein n=1 Tax=Parathielavia hyrcaniae TaxID=113614 RepID=A0AAN6T479_9PEZI|nr:hypothetical protein N658DRAFT_557444 [Parathielavia hyrcaniae]
MPSHSSAFVFGRTSRRAEGGGSQRFTQQPDYATRLCIPEKGATSPNGSEEFHHSTAVGKATWQKRSGALRCQAAACLSPPTSQSRLSKTMRNVRNGKGLSNKDPKWWNAQNPTMHLSHGRLEMDAMYRRKILKNLRALSASVNIISLILAGDLDAIGEPPSAAGAGQWATPNLLRIFVKGGPSVRNRFSNHWALRSHHSGAGTQQVAAVGSKADFVTLPHSINKAGKESDKAAAS